ncbi:glycoside hydrolase superfamily [Echria macrotheca]|uniref:alpha-galactosidase n=1 Tax=Echria macrotheca TaxID=438768 RepID=A0AAJ0B3H4_9PEZI|nr:glycoside hydrolase superfamily [Echria macrotheca]
MKAPILSVTMAWLASLALADIKVPPEFKAGESLKWQIEIQNTLSTSAAVTPSVPVWDVDLFHVARTPKIIDTLRSQNKNVFIICYFNAGLVQKSDCDYNTTWDTPAYRGLLGNVWPEFPNERWINIRNETARTLIKKRITLARDLGCDAADPDNIDGYGVDNDDSRTGNKKTGWNLQPEDDIEFMRVLSKHAHNLTTLRGYTMLIGQKNAPEIGPTLLKESLVDFAVLEDCKGLRDKDADVFCDQFQPFIAAGKPVLSIEYPASLEASPIGSTKCSSTGANSTEYKASCDKTKGNAGFSTVLKIKNGDGELNGCTQYCDAGGVGTGVVVTATDPGKDGAKCPANST